MGIGAKKLCRQPRCGATFRGPGAYCDKHTKPKRPFDRRGNSNRRGYGHGWRKIRLRKLKESGIPQEQWHLYAVDHNPPYNPDIEPDHEKYELVPRLIEDHNRKTATYDGGFGNRKRSK